MPFELTCFRTLPPVVRMWSGRGSVLCELSDGSVYGWGNGLQPNEPTRMTLWDDEGLRMVDMFAGGSYECASTLLTKAQMTAFVCCWKYGSVDEGCALAALPRDLVMLMLEWANALPYVPLASA